MDPFIRSEQPGPLQGSGKQEDEGSSYLRRLRDPLAKAAPAVAPVVGKGAARTGKAAVNWKERRQSPRLRCSGSAEIRAAGSDLRMWGTITDISLHGCYVEMSTTFPIDTSVDLVLKSCGIQIETLATIRASYPFVGMGISFTDIQPEQRAHLKELLTALGGRSVFTSDTPTRATPVKDMLAPIDAKTLLDEITEFFRKNQQLSREEFHKIAKRVGRP